MREIKVRAWYMPFGPKGPMQEMVYSKASSILAFAEMSPDKYIVEQYTDLNDFHGKMIYEGDIVKVTSTDGESYLASIEWCGDDDYPAFDLVGIPPVWRYESNALSAIMAGDERMEIVGNIHEKVYEAPHD